MWLFYLGVLLATICVSGPFAHSGPFKGSGIRIHTLDGDIVNGAGCPVFAIDFRIFAMKAFPAKIHIVFGAPVIGFPVGMFLAFAHLASFGRDPY